MNLTEQFHVPDEYHDACEQITTLVERHANRLLADEYWTDHHIAEVSNHTKQSYTYIRDDDCNNFETTNAYLYSRFKRCIFHRVTHILDAHADEYAAFRFVLDTVDEGPIRSVGWARLRHELFENPESPYVKWGVLETVVGKLNNHYRTHGRFPSTYTDLVACPEPNGTLPYAPDKGDHRIYDLAVEDGAVVVTLNTPDTLDPDSHHEWSEHVVRFPSHARFHDLLDAGDRIGAPTLHASDHGYTLDVPVDVPESTVESHDDRVLAVDLGVKKQATCVPLERDGEDTEENHKQVAPPEFLDHSSKSKLLRLKSNAEGLNDRLSQLRKQGTAHTERFDHLLSEYRRVRQKERRLREQIQHDVANEVVWLAVEHGCSEIVFESLAGLENGARGVTAWSISSWARGTLLDNVEYRAELVDLEVETVNPWGTSRHCPRCGKRGETVNAPNDYTECRHGGHFHCPACGFEGDRDYVGAVNVGRKHFDECKMERATPAAYTAAGNHASFPSHTRRDTSKELCARSADVQSTTDVTGPVSGRQSRRSNQRVPRAERSRNDMDGLPQNHGGNTGWRCPSGSITRYVLTSTTESSRMLPNPIEN
jgi:putative transposase